MKELERFWAYVSKSETCWKWIGPTDGKGRGRFYLRGTQVKAYRYMWELTNSKIPKGYCVCHSCDVPICVNPSHLFLGTQLDNIKDRNGKGRTAKHQGESNGRAKLTEKEVRYIREAFESGVFLANKFGVTPTLISRIQTGKAWKHV